MPTISGNLRSILDFDPEVGIGSVEVALCGYGSQVPRMNGQGIVARVTDDNITVEPDGSFEFELTGNDEIQPQGTYYTVTIKDDNGDIVQCNAYQFPSIPDAVDLDQETPFDPSQAIPPPLPPLLIDLLGYIDESNPVIDGSQYPAWQVTLTGDCTPVVTNIVDGNLYTIIIIQSPPGGHAFNWPSNVANASPADRTSNSITIQTFVGYGGVMYAVGPATYYDA